MLIKKRVLDSDIFKELLSYHILNILHKLFAKRSADDDIIFADAAEFIQNFQTVFLAYVFKQIRSDDRFKTVVGKRQFARITLNVVFGF